MRNWPLLKNDYLNKISLLDSSISTSFKSQFESLSQSYDPDFSLNFIREKVKNDILLLESSLSDYFDLKVGGIKEPFTSYSILLGQNTNHLKTGETLEIVTGLGAFTTSASPSFNINGNNIEPDANKQAVYRMKVSGKGKKTDSSDYLLYIF